MATESSDINDAHAFYNKIQEQGLDRRNESKIYYLRNFNNWIKSTLIDEYLRKLKTEHSERKNDIHVFDMGCGKGGDQLKWSIGEVRFVTFADLAENLVELCKQRYVERKSRTSFEGEFYSLNCTTELLRDKRQSSEPIYDLVSTQFVIHYTFDRYESANRFLRNAAELLRIGGYFIGTTVNSCDLLERCRQSDNLHLSNDVYEIKFDPSIDWKREETNSIPLFGAKYHFTLDELVDCPEYLLYFPLLEKLAERHGLELVDRQTFHDYFATHKNTEQSRKLMQRMKALQSYRLPRDGQEEPLVDPNQFTHAERHLHENNGEHPNQCCATLSQQEWEVTSLYITFAFKKVRHINYDDDNTVD